MQGTKRVANFSESMGMQFAIVHVSDEDDRASSSTDSRNRPAASLVGNVKVRKTMFIRKEISHTIKRLVLLFRRGINVLTG